jgi:hypothetical protein
MAALLRPDAVEAVPDPLRGLKEHDGVDVPGVAEDVHVAATDEP